MLIDEWDALCREAGDRPHLLEQYISLLRNLFKGDNTNRVFAGVYMTGILPIKSYGTQSALNNFRMYSMTNPEPLEEFFGFSESEVEAICAREGLDFQELSLWYDGYRMGDGDVRIFNPTSVMTVLLTRVCKGYWTQTESFESVKELINMNFDGVKEALEAMLSRKAAQVTVSTFGNDSNVINSKDELLTLLIHYGYLGYDAPNQRAFIPNNEVRQEVMQALRSLIHLAYIAAVDDYVQIQELPAGTGCADVVFIPRKGCDKPAMIIELKFGGSAEGAIAQVRNRNYPQLVREFTDRLLLVGINYDKKTKRHECRIERWEKTQGVAGENSGSKAENSSSKRKKSRSIKTEKIVGFCSEPKTLEEIAAFMGVKDKNFMKKMCIDPVLGIRLRMSEPNSPTSPTQKYLRIDSSAPESPAPPR